MQQNDTSSNRWTRHDGATEETFLVTDDAQSGSIESHRYLRGDADGKHSRASVSFTPNDHFSSTRPASTAYPTRSSPYSLTGEVFAPYNPLPASAFAMANGAYPEPGGVLNGTMSDGSVAQTRSVQSSASSYGYSSSGVWGKGHAYREEILGHGAPQPRPHSTRRFQPSSPHARSQSLRVQALTHSNQQTRVHGELPPTGTSRYERLYASPDDPSLALSPGAQQFGTAGNHGLNFSDRHSDAIARRSLPAPSSPPRRNFTAKYQRTPSNLRHSPYPVSSSDSSVSYIAGSNSHSQATTAYRSHANTQSVISLKGRVRNDICNANQLNNRYSLVAPHPHSNVSGEHNHTQITSAHSGNIVSSEIIHLARVEEPKGRSHSPPMWSLRALAKSQNPDALDTEELEQVQNSGDDVNSTNVVGIDVICPTTFVSLITRPLSHERSVGVRTAAPHGHVQESLNISSHEVSNLGFGVSEMSFGTSHAGQIKNFDTTNDPVLQEIAEDWANWHADSQVGSSRNIVSTSPSISFLDGENPGRFRDV